MPPKIMPTVVNQNASCTHISHTQDGEKFSRKIASPNLAHNSPAALRLWRMIHMTWKLIFTPETLIIEELTSHNEITGLEWNIPYAPPSMTWGSSQRYLSQTQMSSSSARVLHNACCSPQSEEIWDSTCNKSPKCCTEGGNLKKQL
jgi:hypothetical protein